MEPLFMVLLVSAPACCVLYMEGGITTLHAAHFFIHHKPTH